MSLFVDYASIDGNKPPDTAKAKAFGIKGAIVRGAFTLAGMPYPDPHCARDADAWRLAGSFGSYMILGWHVDPVMQAEKFITAYERKRGDLPPSLDLEADSAITIGMKPEQALEWAHRAYDVLVAHYGTVMIYTSARVWQDVFGGLASRMAASPLWLKIPYPYRAGQPPHLECANPTGPELLPLPWNAPSAGGVWLKQFQGDAKGVDGFSSTVDLSVFCNYDEAKPDRRKPFVTKLLAVHGATSVAGYQKENALAIDGVIGPVTFENLTYGL